MRTPRVFLHATSPPDGTVDLPPEESRHLSTVLRRSAGDRVILALEGGECLEAEITEVRREKDGPVVQVRVFGPSKDRASLLVPWTVAVAVVKGEALESAIRAASELGLERLVPLLTARTVVRPRASGSAQVGSAQAGVMSRRAQGWSRVERWRRLAREAAKQCGRARPLEVAEPCGFAEFVSGWRALAGPGGRGWILVPSAPFCPEALLSSAVAGGATEAGGVAPAVFVVGPEGGFAPEEVAQAAAAGLAPLGLPTPTLRTPTAVALVAALGIILGARAGWVGQDDRSKSQSPGLPAGPHE